MKILLTRPQLTLQEKGSDLLLATELGPTESDPDDKVELGWGGPTVESSRVDPTEELVWEAVIEELGWEKPDTEPGWADSLASLGYVEPTAALWGAELTAELGFKGHLFSWLFLAPPFLIT